MKKSKKSHKKQKQEKERTRRHITQHDRDRIQVMRDDGIKQKDIAKILRIL